MMKSRYSIIEKIENHIYSSNFFYFYNKLDWQEEIRFDKIETERSDTYYFLIYNINEKKLIIHNVESDEGEDWYIDAKINLDEFSEKIQEYLNTLSAIAKI